jgi:tetratricopeptide (TPR) repeat protein
MATQPVEGGAAHDAQNPGERLAVGETADRAQRPPARLCDDLFGDRPVGVPPGEGGGDQGDRARWSARRGAYLYGRDWAAAEREYEQAIRLSPAYATLHHWYAWRLLVVGRPREGVAELARAESLDPLSTIIGADLADALCIVRRYDESIRQSRKTLELDPNFAVGHYQLGQALVQTGAFDEAIAEFQKAIALSGHLSAFDSNLAYAYATAGRAQEATKIADDLAARADRDQSADANVAVIYVWLGDFDQAIDWLNKAYEARFNPSILLRPARDPLRSDARFKNLLHRIGLS